MRTLGEVGKDTVAGACRGGFWGAAIGGLGTLALAVATGGLAVPVVLAAAPVAAEIALTGAEVGAGVGGVMGATGYKEDIDKAAGAVIGLALTTVAGGAIGDHRA